MGRGANFKVCVCVWGGGGGGIIMLYLHVDKSAAYPLLLDFRTLKENIFPPDKLQSIWQRGLLRQLFWKLSIMNVQNLDFWYVMCLIDNMNQL